VEYRLKTYIAADNIISALGFSTEENVRAIEAYRSGIRNDTSGTIADTDLLAATIDADILYGKCVENRLIPFSKLEQLIILSIKSLSEQKTIDFSDKQVALLLATTKGNVECQANNTDNFPVETRLWHTAERIKTYFGFKNDVTVVSNACISGVTALITAKRLLEEGIYRHVVVTGVDVLSHFITSGFLSFKSISEHICRPYDSKRDGLNLGEACGSILLTVDEMPDALVLSGGGVSNDANHISGPSKTGDGLHLAIQQAIRDSGCTAEDIDAANLHGTATRYNDEMEAKAIHLSQLQNVPVNSFKSYFGHTLGAAGVIETIICGEQLKKNTVFGTYRFEESDLSCALQLSDRHTKRPISHCLKTASGFGGCNAALILSKQTAVRPQTKKVTPTTKEINRCRIENSAVFRHGTLIFKRHATDFPTFIRDAYKHLCEATMKFYKMDNLSKLACVAAECLLKDITFEPSEIGIILANSSASSDTDKKHQAIIDKEGDKAASPSIFVYTLPNVAIGEICIRHKIQGENTCYVSEKYRPDEIEQHAVVAMKNGGLKYCIYGWCDLTDNSYKADFKLLENIDYGRTD
jgi:3-oxoacyl-(acyl-carrier-protein) synthase